MVLKSMVAYGNFVVAGQEGVSLSGLATHVPLSFCTFYLGPLLCSCEVL